MIVKNKVGKTVKYITMMERLARTSKRNFRSIYNWFSYERPLAQASGSANYIKHPDDFVSLSPKQKDQALMDLVVRLLERGPAWARKVLCP
jgi:hypothetical protein